MPQTVISTKRKPAGTRSPEEPFLSDTFVRQLAAVGEVDILIGIPTFNNRSTIEQITQAIQIGLVKYFPRERAAVINPDGGSRDGTPEVVRNSSIQNFRTLLSSSPLRTIHRISTPYPAIEGKSSAFRIILAAADLLRAKACAILSPDLESISPEWVENLIRPVYREKFDLVTPIYHRHKFDGLLIRNMIAPVIRALYGVRIREPVGTELGFSGQLAVHAMEEDVWNWDIVRANAELWMTTTAIVGGFKLCQSFLGPKIHAPKSNGIDIVMAIQNAVGALFRCMEAQESFWASRNESSSQPVPIFGFEYSSGLEPRRLNRKKMLAMFRNGVEQLAPVLSAILSPGTLQGIQKISKEEEKEFRFPDELWARTVYEFASSYHRSVISRDHLLQALVPVYRGKICSTLLEDYRAGAEQIEKETEALALTFEKLKPELVEKWGAKA